MLSQYTKLQKLFDFNFLEYTSYVIRERAIPDIKDGLKPVQRRILQTLHLSDDGRFHKVANIVGSTMKLHPHGDASIFSALVNLANKDYLIEKQGNFGNIFTGDQASAARYIECRLTPLAREVLFNKDLTEFVDSYDGRMKEPVAFPAKIPLLLLQGAEGIAVGMATKIMPHNFNELLEAQKRILQDQEIELYPDFPKKGFVDVSQYNSGNGKIRCRARVEEPNEKTILIKEIPHTTTTQSLIDSIEKAAKAGKLKIASINDYTAEEVEIEIKLSRGIYTKDTIKALYAFTDCEVSISPNLTLIKDNMPVTMGVEEVLRENTEQLVATLTLEQEIELGRLQAKLHARLLEQIFIQERVYKRIEDKTSYKAVVKSVEDGLSPFISKLEKDVTLDDIERLLQIKIKRISQWDINKQKKEIRTIRADIKQIEKNLQDMVGFTISYIDSLLDRFGANYPRQTEIREFKEVSVRKAALSNLTIGYDRGSGFLGHQVKIQDEKNDISFTCSEYDKILLIYSTGKYQVIPASDKLFVGHELAWVGVVRKDLLFNIIYRDGKENKAYVKRFKTPKFILNKEYELFACHKRSKILLFTQGEQRYARVYLMPSRRAKSNIIDIDFDSYLIKGATAKGKRVSPRIVRRVIESDGSHIKKKEEKQNLPLPGIEGEE